MISLLFIIEGSRLVAKSYERCKATAVFRESNVRIADEPANLKKAIPSEIWPTEDSIYKKTLMSQSKIFKQIAVSSICWYLSKYKILERNINLSKLYTFPKYCNKNGFMYEGLCFHMKDYIK